ncbi:MAG: LysR family transcriptional regulator [Piscinibacter sp.]|uniref:LysR substrate-binding domain-containing protein n=1 Tax=Piscinibacter sp. TaxID=1903157 RepID=UPI00258CC085|nr:LysR substrate-binding domain-containing protein [Piscinibacter sp.]MCW5667066.1 LysR family transcriptional regulator [Piscinibacter sp.]
MRMSLRQLENFVAVAETGSIRAAARGLRVSQPTVTKSVRHLEDELHAQLVQRTPQGVTLTSTGRNFLARVRAAQAELRKAQEEVAYGRTGAAPVALGVGPVAAVMLAPQAVARFHLESPGATVRVVEGFPPALLPQVRDGTLDFAIGPKLDVQIDPALSFRPLFREDFAVVARKDHPLRGVRSLAQLVDAEWAALWKSGLPNSPLDRIFAAAGLPLPRQVVQCESYNLVVSVVARTHMLTLLSRRSLALPLARDTLQALALREQHPQLTVGMFTRAGAPMTQHAAAFAKVLVSEARALVKAG